MCEWCPTVQFLSQSLGKDKDPSANKTKKPSDIRLKHSHSWNQLTPFASSCTSLINSSTLSWIIYVKLTRVYPGCKNIWERRLNYFPLRPLTPEEPNPQSRFIPRIQPWSLCSAHHLFGTSYTTVIPPKMIQKCRCGIIMLLLLLCLSLLLLLSKVLTDL